VAAGFLIAHEAGAAISPFFVAAADGTIPLDDPAFVAASTPELLAEIRAFLHRGHAA
jgi:hypothetical protein